MMNVQTMRLIVDVLHTGAMPGAAQEAMRLWNGESLAYVRSSANHIFRFSQNGRPRYLRLSHGTERQRAFLRAELEFVQQVASAGLAVARPLPSVNGRLIEEVKDDGQLYYAVVFEGLEGEQLELDDLNETMYRVWGRTLGLMHRASKAFPIHPERHRWQDELRSALDTLPADEIEVRMVIESGLAWLDTLPVEDYGLIHGDFELDNLIWDGRQFQILDFDGAVYSWYGVDIATALQDVWREGGAEREKRQRWFLEGYGEVASVPNHIHAMIPHCLNLLTAFKVAGLLRAYATTTEDGSTDWLMDMKRYHQKWLTARRAMLEQE
jgi:Ser/Thr protein kinase RdoA (MazF antagonist)